MRRSGALTLGAVLMLGGVSDGQGQELSGAAPGHVKRAKLSVLRRPCFTDAAGELERFAGEADGVPISSVQQQYFWSCQRCPAAPGQRAWRFYLDNASLALSTKPYWFWSGQEFFFDASFGEVRYLRQVDFNSDIYTVDAGVNWTYASRCSGALTALASKSPTTVTTQVVNSVESLLGANYSTTTSFNETGNCAFGNEYSAIFNSSETQTSNSTLVNRGSITLEQQYVVASEALPGDNAVTYCCAVFAHTDGFEMVDRCPNRKRRSYFCFHPSDRRESAKYASSSFRRVAEKRGSAPAFQL